MYKLLAIFIVVNYVIGQNSISEITVPIEDPMLIQDFLIIGTFLPILSETFAVTVNVGGIFEGVDQNEELAFNVAIDKINRQKLVPHHRFEPLSAHIEPENIIDTILGRVVDVNWDRPFPALESACSLLSTGVVGIFTSILENSASAVESLCDTKEIPVFRTTPDKRHKRQCCSVHLYPHMPIVAKAFADLIRYQNWDSFTVLYESDDTFVNIAEIFKVYNVTDHNILVQQLYYSDSGEYRDALKAVRRSKQTNFVIHCFTVNLSKILKQAQEVGLMMKKFSYIILNLDLETIDLTPFQHSRTNITSIRLVDPSNPKVKRIANAIQSKRKDLRMETFEPGKPEWNLKTSTALMVDGVMLFAKTLKDVGSFNVKSLFCDSADSWEHGSTIFNFMKMKTLDGLTGLVQFDLHGIRIDFTLDVIELRESGVTKTGEWDSNNGLRMFPLDLTTTEDPSNLRNKHLRVMIAWSDPYAFYKETSARLHGNDQFQGFVVDLIHEISLLEGFNYTLIRTEDNKNGDYNATTNSWNGMIGDILNGVGDIALGDLAITKDREEVVDFTSPFMSLGTQILYQRPSKQEPDVLSFSNPFAPEVWLLIGVSYFLVSIGLFLMSRVCQEEWDNWDPCVQNPKYLVNQFNIRNSFWYVIGNFMQQGAEIAPRGASTRILSSFFAFFILVVVSLYKAQLAAFLTTEVLELPFNNVEELVKRADKLKIAYGAVANEATHMFFRLSQDEIYKQVGQYMDAHPEHMVLENYDGAIKVEEGNYAFFMESVTIKFAVNLMCNLTSVGERLDERFFGIAMRKNSPYRNRLSEAILKLQENGKLDQLERKWWRDFWGSLLCLEPQPNPNAPPLNLFHVSGIFWITMLGVVFAFCLVFVELAVHVFIKCGRNRKEFIKEYKKEIRFAFSFSKTIKPLKNGKIASIRRDNNESDR